MKTKMYCVAISNYFDGVIRQFIVYSKDDLDAVKQALLMSCGKDNKQEEIDWQNSKEYPTDIESLKNYLGNAEITFTFTKFES
jgi:hypothetical protein